MTTMDGNSYDQRYGEGPRRSDLPDIVEAQKRIAAFAARGITDRLESRADEIDKGSLDLSRLGLQSSHLADLAAALTPLRNLTSLWLQDNQLTSTPELASVLVKLTELITLDLRHNHITPTRELADALKQHTTLQRIYINGNKLGSAGDLASAVQEAAGLREHYIYTKQPMPARAWARALISLASFDLPRDDSRYLDVISHSCHPRQIVRAIEDYLAGKSRLNPEFKLVLLGQGEVGKTQLWRRLLGKPFQHTSDRTHSFEWQELPEQFQPCWPPGELETEVTPEGETETFRFGRPAARVHLFDFGGQDALWASHRFFVSSRQAVFVVVASREHSLAKSRLGFWLRYVGYVWEEDCQHQASLEAAEKCREIDDEEYATMLMNAKKKTSKPPVLVVLTHADAEAPELVSEASRLCSELRTRGHLVELVEDYDSKIDVDGARIEAVRQKLAQIVYAPELRPVWTTPMPSYIIDRRAKCRDVFGFGADGFQSNPQQTQMTVDEFFTDVCGLDPPGPNGPDQKLANDRRDAMVDLATLRDLGVVHWVGDRVGQVEPTEKICHTIFSPAAVRGPVYNVLWSKRDDHGAFSHGELIEEIRKSPPSGQGDTLVRDDHEADLLLRLMCVCGLIFEGKGKHGVKRYLVPDRLPSGTPLLIPNDAVCHKSETLLKADFGFVPDMLMPRLIGKLWSSFTCRDLRRCSCIVDWELSEGAVPVRICADQNAGVIRVGVMGENDGDISEVKKELEVYLAEILQRKRQGIRLEIVRDGVKRPSSTVGSASGGASDADTGSRTSSPNTSAPSVVDEIKTTGAPPAARDPVKFGFGPKQNRKFSYAFDAYRRACVYFVRAGIEVEDWQDLFNKISEGDVPDISEGEFTDNFNSFGTFSRYVRKVWKKGSKPWWETQLSLPDYLSAVTPDGRRAIDRDEE